MARPEKERQRRLLLELAEGLCLLGSSALSGPCLSSFDGLSFHVPEEQVFIGSRAESTHTHNVLTEKLLMRLAEVYRYLIQRAACLSACLSTLYIAVAQNLLSWPLKVKQSFLLLIFLEHAVLGTPFRPPGWELLTEMFGENLV